MLEDNLNDNSCRALRASSSPYFTSQMGQFGVTSWTVPAGHFSANDQLKLLGKLREKVAGSDFNMSVFLGEGHQSLQMIAGAAIRLAKTAHHLKRGDLAGAARSLFAGADRAPLKRHKDGKAFKPSDANVASNWLELQYGWLPLLKDAEAGAQTLAHALSAPVQKTFRMSLKRKYSAVRTTPAGPWTTPVKAVAIGFHRRSLKVIVSEPPHPVELLGLTNPELVLWELVPFSFVADWFLPIGDYLEARAITSIVKGTYVTGDLIVSRSFPPTGGCLTDIEPCSGYRRIQSTRTVSTAPQMPLPAFKSLKQVASWQHCANAIALLNQAFTGKRVWSR
jgi:hypothetical protein